MNRAMFRSQRMLSNLSSGSVLKRSGRNVASFSTARSANTGEEGYSNRLQWFAVGAISVMASLSVASSSSWMEAPAAVDEDEDGTTILNWSGTHEVVTSNYYEPSSVEELEKIVRECHLSNTPIRPVGSALSPNGISFHKGGMVSLAHLDEILHVDKENMTVTVQAGARVSQVVEALRAHNLTLPNLASIAEQQMGGFVQVGAHGSGALVSPVDEYVTSYKLVTPQLGTIELKPPTPFFYLARVGIGSLGIVSEITMQCIPAHNLVEHTYVLTRKEAKANVKELLKNHKHVRYMWIPYEDAVVVVTNDPENDDNKDKQKKKDQTTDPLEPLTQLLKDLTSTSPPTDLGFTGLRDALLEVDPLDPEHIKKVNKAEAQVWKNNQGWQTKPSDQLLQFDCGGQQWVWEICFPTGTYQENDGTDMEFMEKLLHLVETHGLPAPSPIEQRWSASSSSTMSPAHGEPDGLHSYVGIIMYLPLDNKTQREHITNIFREKYCPLFRTLGNQVNAKSHWAKLEIPDDPKELEDLQKHIRKHYPVDLFNVSRAALDPKNLMAGNVVNGAFGVPSDLFTKRGDASVTPEVSATKE